MSERPDCLVLVTGTGTGVGKTWFTAATARALRRLGLVVAARKPVQSYDPAEPRTDADALAAATGEEPDQVCHPGRWLEVPMAPPMAADHLGRAPLLLGDLMAEITWPPGVAIGFVEGVGGPRSPIADDADTAALGAALEPDVVVLVADAALGAVNAVRVSADALAGRPLVVALNRYDRDDELHRRNAEWLADRDGYNVITDPSALADVLRSTVEPGEVKR